MGWKATLRVGGKVYRFYSNHINKQSAEKEAKELRAKGWAVKIVSRRFKGKVYLWQIYRRRSERRKKKSRRR